MKNILLIDDNLNHLSVLAVALADAGYQVIPKIDARTDHRGHDGIEMVDRKINCEAENDQIRIPYFFY
jgi:CheY-like chemotaxis protein